MSVIDNVSYTELSKEFYPPFYTELELLTDEICCVLCEIQAVILVGRKSYDDNTSQIYSSNWRLDAMH